MIKWIKSLFKPTVVQINSIQDLFPFYDPDNFIIGVKKGSIDRINKEKLFNGLHFEFNGTINDFVVLPKSKAKESDFIKSEAEDC